MPVQVGAEEMSFLRLHSLESWSGKRSMIGRITASDWLSGRITASDWLSGQNPVSTETRFSKKEASTYETTGEEEEDKK